MRFFNKCPQVLDIVDFYCYPYVCDIRSIVLLYLHALLQKNRSIMLYMVSPLYSFDLEVAIDAQNVSFPVSLFPSTSPSTRSASSPTKSSSVFATSTPPAFSPVSPFP